MRRTLLVAIVCAVCLAGPAVVVADYYDNFDDGEYCQDPNDPNIYDPNLWDPCNPHWTGFPALYTDWLIEVNSGWLRLYVTNTLYPYSFGVAYVDDLDYDPNTSATWYDNSAPHYLVSRVMINVPDVGVASLLMRGNAAQWLCYIFEYEAWNNNLLFTAVNGLDFAFGKRSQVFEFMDPNDPRYPDESGFWMLMQFDRDGPSQDPNGSYDPNDPNNFMFRSAIWNGGKYDWNGQYDLELNLINDNWPPGGLFGYEDRTEGFPALVSSGSEACGIIGDNGFDEVEARWGYFGEYSPHTLTLKLKDANAIYVYPNYPHPDGGAKRLYPKGMVVACDATCNGTKTFKKWTIKGPNDESDPLYQVVVDTNAVLYLTMDGDYLVKATCKCGGGGVEPFAAMVLLVLGVSLVLRRLT